VITEFRDGKAWRGRGYFDHGEALPSPGGCRTNLRQPAGSAADRWARAECSGCDPHHLAL